MKHSQIYRKAAMIVDAMGGYACPAIVAAMSDNYDPNPLWDFAVYFRPRHKPIVWFGTPSAATDDHRILALCLMAAIAESEGK